MEKLKIKKRAVELENFDSFTREELIQRIVSLEAHNAQLKNILNKSQEVSSNTRKSSNFDFTKHILLRFFYLGWDYQGFVIQEDTINTIEYHIFEALMKTCLIKDRSSSEYHRCGRTDKGVSSFGQAISLNVRSKLTVQDMDKLNEEIDYCKVLNRVLPQNIQCIAWAPAEEKFSARFDCKGRTYKYFFPKGNLNIEKMRSAGKYIIGVHDFRNFCKMDVGNGVVQFIRNILNFTIEPVTQQPENEFVIYVATIKGQAFLWHQIRCIMGVLLLIGENKEEPTVLKELLDIESNARKPEYNMASEVPLSLFSCEYGNVDWQYSKDNLKFVVQNLSKIWTFSTIKQTMVTTILTELISISNSINPDNITDLTGCLIQGVKAKKYVPLMKRQRCESLEEKIKHFTKRKCIEVTSENN